MRAALIVNPIKVEDVPGLRAQVAAVSAEAGWDEPLLYETTLEDPGVEFTRAAVEEGVDVVMPCGGDGTVMAVVTGLAGSGVAMGILPWGTGNLLARNLDLPTDVAAAIALAIHGDVRPLDVGRVEMDGGEVKCFAVMAGLGLDAAMMADAPEGLKSRFGWPAYIVSGARHLADRAMIVGLRIDDGHRLVRRARTVVVGNVGRLQGGMQLMPDADPSDGLLDVVVLAPRGAWDWLLVAGRVLARRRGSVDRRLERFSCRRVEIRTPDEQPRQLDGDPLGSGRHLVIEVEHHALLVKMPSPA